MAPKWGSANQDRSFVSTNDVIPSWPKWVWSALKSKQERERENEPFLKTLWGRKWLALKIQFWWRQKPLEIFWIGETFILDENFRCKKLIETILNKSIDFRIMKTFGIKKPFKQVPLKRFSYLFTTCGPHPLAETQTLTAKTMLWLSIGK